MVFDISGLLAGFIDAIAGGGGLISVPALTAMGMPIPLVLGYQITKQHRYKCIAVYKY